jgi:hypothetical protein
MASYFEPGVCIHLAERSSRDCEQLTDEAAGDADAMFLKEGNDALAQSWVDSLR